ncbi:MULTISPECIES: hypothetical protein [Mesorhizobium]|uniref:hypothetical protein n=1 Tax=Mesorhizobium TaxID=68287 RepID=UPI00333CE176
MIAMSPLEAATLKMRMKLGDGAVQSRWQAQSSSLGVKSRLAESVPDMAAVPVIVNKSVG